MDNIMVDCKDCGGWPCTCHDKDLECHPDHDADERSLTRYMLRLIGHRTKEEINTIFYSLAKTSTDWNRWQKQEKRVYVNANCAFCKCITCKKRSYLDIDGGSCMRHCVFFCFESKVTECGRYELDREALVWYVELPHLRKVTD